MIIGIVHSFLKEVLTEQNKGVTVPIKLIGLIRACSR